MSLKRKEGIAEVMKAKGFYLLLYRISHRTLSLQFLTIIHIIKNNTIITPLFKSDAFSIFGRNVVRYYYTVNSELNLNKLNNYYKLIN